MASIIVAPFLNAPFLNAADLFLLQALHGQSPEVGVYTYMRHMHVACRPFPARCTS